MANIEKRLNDLAQRLAPGDELIVIESWGPDEITNPTTGLTTTKAEFLAWCKAAGLKTIQLTWGDDSDDTEPEQAN